MMLWRYCTQYVSKFGKLNSGHRTGQCQFSFQSQRRAMPKNVQIPHNFTYSHTIKVTLKILQARLQEYVNYELLDVQAEFRKGRGTRDQLPTSIRSSKKKERVSEEHLLLLYWLCQSLWLSELQQTVENSERDGNTRPTYLPPEKSVHQSRSNS